MMSKSRFRDDKVNLVGESFPNYARIDHFTMNPQQDDTLPEKLVRTSIESKVASMKVEREP